MPKDIPVVTGAVGAEADTRDPGQTRRSGPLRGAKLKLAQVWVAEPSNSGITQAAAGCRDTVSEASD